jgi:hypothetical protein
MTLCTRAACIAIALGAAAATTTEPARADEIGQDKVGQDKVGQDKAGAQALFDQAKELLARGNAVEACPKLEESQRLDPTSGTLINLADCYERQGRISTAWTTFLQAAATAKAAGYLEREQVARDRASALVLRLPKIVIKVVATDIDGLDVKRDGVLVGRPQWGTPMPVDPGQHRIFVSAPSRRTWETVVTLPNVADTTTVVVPALDPLPGAPSTGGLGTPRVMALVAGGVGVAGLVAGAAFGFVSKFKHDEADGSCTGSRCRDQAGVDLRNEAVQAGNLSTAGFIVGAAGLIAGATLWLTAKDDSTTGGHSRIGVGLGTLVLTKTW